MIPKTLVAGAVAMAFSGCGAFGGDDDAKDRAELARNIVRIVATASTSSDGERQEFHTEKDFHPPRITVPIGPADGTSRGHIFLTPRAADPDIPTGPLVLDHLGRMIFFRPLPDRVPANLTPQRYKGKPVLTWSERPPVASPPEIFKVAPEDAFHVIVDQHYKEITKVRAAGEGVGTDMHEFVITKRNTALVLGFRTHTKDLTAIGGSSEGKLVETVIQEVDIATGRLLLEWSPAEQVPVTDSYFPLPLGDDPWDAYHANAISVARDGNLLVTMRHTSAVYKVDRKTGETIWTLGGKSSDFRRERGAVFHFAHDAHELPNGNLLVFDNGATDKDRRAEESRVIELELDMKRKRVSVEREIVHDPPILSISQGNARVLENGNIFVGWGNRQWFSEYTRHGQQLFDGQLPGSPFHSYRAFKSPWPAQPHGKPAIAASLTGNRTLVYASWNGATDITQWRVLGGPSQGGLKPLGSGDWEDFETKLDVARTLPVVQVEALDRQGNVLGRSDPIKPQS